MNSRRDDGPAAKSLDVDRLQAELRRFAAERRWERFHNPKNLAMALSVEVSELAEHFQWLTPEEAAAVADDPGVRASIEDEIADVGIYLLRLADVLGVDLAPAVEAKMRRNADRFPPS